MGNPKPSPTYVDLLRRRWQEKFGDGGKTAKQAGLTEHTYGRLFKRGKETIKSAVAFSRVLRREGVPMPPPAVAIIDDEDYAWITLGRHLRQERPAEWQALLDLLRAKRPDLELALDIEEEVQRMVTGVTDVRRRRNDDGDRGGGENAK